MGTECVCVCGWVERHRRAAVFPESRTEGGEDEEGALESTCISETSGRRARTWVRSVRHLPWTQIKEVPNLSVIRRNIILLQYLSKLLQMPKRPMMKKKINI